MTAKTVKLHFFKQILLQKKVAGVNGGEAEAQVECSKMKIEKKTSSPHCSAPCKVPLHQQSDTNGICKTRPRKSLVPLEDIEPSKMAAKGPSL